ncbi:DUF3231 family protein [Evansella sp. AB-P1]|uniref:DUF3231 family protein n=1 Tax=Evansella sp. AB-P1 TaxID=3037653 RepID=UPI00241D5249|nr:DUF3231 family protein [Evansella sp. AB-P1]MDG5788972.1 DUF3231 family protein [Evansella sp. AB-P1]
MSTNNIPLTSSELNNLWMSYQEKTMVMRFFEHFLEHADDKEVQQLLTEAYDDSSDTVSSIKSIFNKEEAAIPIGFTEEDVKEGAPKLFDYLYEIMFLHMISKIEVNLYALYSTMSYRQDIRSFFSQLTVSSQKMFDKCCQFLLEKGALVPPPFVSMPKEASFVRSTDYLSGFHIVKETRSLNTTELSLIHHAIETNLAGMQLMLGFAQASSNKEVKDYFIKGMKLSKDIETTLGEYLRRDYIEPPATHAGKATNSTVAPFSQKMMMYLTNLLSTFGLGSNAIGGAFSLRSDLPMTMARLSTKVYSFAKNGGEIMIKNGWMEEPPKVEDRQQLTK